MLNVRQFQQGLIFLVIDINNNVCSLWEKACRKRIRIGQQSFKSKLISCGIENRLAIGMDDNVWL
jgi:hypothetical protein